MKNSAVKQNIIETASNLFYTKGYNLTGINEIIAQAGIAKATLYNHFKSKEEICIAYLNYMNSTFIKDINQFCKSRKKGKNQLLAVFDYLTQFFKDKDFNGCWCIKTVSELPKENENVKSVIRAQKNMLLAFLKELIIQNDLRSKPKDTEILARQIYLLYESAVSESHLHQDDWPIKSAKLLAKEIVG